MKNRKNLILYLILVYFLVLSISANLINKYKTQTTFNVDATSPAEIKDELIIALFIEDVTSASNGFYEEYFTMTPAIYNYEIKVQKISKELGKINITFGINPMIGAHDPVGYDEASYQIDSSGNKTFISFVHLKTYDIPDHLKNLIKKELP
ncbi:DUF3888 domain-containing protein [Lacrimispora sp. 38-1]|uniref:DUF3888 domain-containing protein n=1 Tax=Lacrimispora sp. 38-1 TaxID=3125778 RepID=UPI003CE7F709